METTVETTRGYYERIKCPKCSLGQKAKVLMTKPYHTKEHTCIACGYEIKGAEWDTVYTNATENVVCPFCATEIGYYVDMADCDGQTIACECGKDFKLSVEVKLEFTSITDCELNKDEHDWAESIFITSKQTIFYHCTKCDATKHLPRLEEEVATNGD